MTIPKNADSEKAHLDSDSITTSFKLIGEKLEVRYRKFDEICQYSRNITWESKKTISNILGFFDDPTVLDRAEKRLRFILASDKCFKGLVMTLYTQDKYMFVRAYSPGVQEFIEALALLTFFKYRKLLSYEELLEMLTFDLPVPKDKQGIAELESPATGEESSTSPIEIQPEVEKINVPLRYSVFIPKTDFFLGLSDVTGELMRACASGVQTSDFKSFLFEACTLVRILYQSMSCICPFPRGMSSKINTMRASMSKLELACYNYVMNRHLCPINFRAGKNALQVEYNENEDSGYD